MEPTKIWPQKTNFHLYENNRHMHGSGQLWAFTTSWWQHMTAARNYLDDSSDVHLGDHLGGVEEHEQRVQRERHILQRRVMLECFGRVHANGDDADDGTGPQQSVHPL